MKTPELDSTYIPALDLLAHAYGALDNWEKTGFYGHQALALKDKAIPDLEHEIIPIPAPKNGKRIISFSLFGNNSKYIEPAVLNTQLAPVFSPVGHVVFMSTILYRLKLFNDLEITEQK